MTLSTNKGRGCFLQAAVYSWGRYLRKNTACHYAFLSCTPWSGDFNLPASVVSATILGIQISDGNYIQAAQFASKTSVACELASRDFDGSLCKLILST